MPSKKSIHFPDSETGESDKPTTAAAGRKSLKITTGEHRVSAGEKAEDTISVGSRRSRSSQGSKNRKGLRRKSVKMGNKIIEELLATEPTESTVMTGTGNNRRKSDKQETGSAHSQVKIPRKSKATLSTSSRESSLTRKKRISKKSGTDEAAPLARKASSKSSTVSLTRKSFAPQKWSFKKSLQTRIQEEGIEDTGSKKDPSITSSLVKKKLSIVRVGPSKGRGSMKSRKSAATIKKSKGSTNSKTLDYLQLTQRLFKLDLRSDDEENQKVWSLRTALPCKKKTLLILGLVVLLLIMLIAITVIFARLKGGGQGGGQGIGSNNNTSTTVMPNSTQPLTTTDKCGDVPPRNETKTVGEYCNCKFDGLKCDECCGNLGLPNDFLDCVNFCNA